MSDKQPAVSTPMCLADLIFERIKHGDEKHQQWLREKSVEIAAEFGALSERTSPFDRDYLAKIERDAATMKVLRMLLREAHGFLNAQCVVEEDYADWEKRYKAFTESLDRLAAGVAFVTDTRLGGD